MIEAFWRSCYDFRWLLTRKDAPMGRVFAHLGVLALALTAARAATVGPALRTMIDSGARFVANDMPEVRIEHGRTRADVPQPWVKNFDAEFQLVIDTTGQTQSIDPAYPTGVLIGPDRIVYKRGPEAEQPIDLSKVGDFSTRGPKFQQWVGEVRAWVYPVLVPLTAVFSVAGLALRWLAVASLGLWFAGPLSIPLGWDEIVRIGAYAATPAVYFILLGTLTPLSVMLVPTLAQIFFLGMALWLAKEDAEALPGGTNGWRPPTDDDSKD